jgi:hypothetical protein
VAFLWSIGGVLFGDQYRKVSSVLFVLTRSKYAEIRLSAWCKVIQTCIPSNQESLCLLLEISGCELPFPESVVTKDVGECLVRPERFVR